MADAVVGSDPFDGLSERTASEKDLHPDGENGVPDRIELASPGRRVLFVGVRLPRVMIALLLAWAWCSGVWHEDLEAAGWFFDHPHAHAGHHDHATGHAPQDESCPVEDEHPPVWARGVMVGGFFSVLSMLLLVAAILPVAWMSGFDLRLVRARLGRPLGRLRTLFEPQWCFVRRCAPDAIAPPVLG